MNQTFTKHIYRVTFKSPTYHWWWSLWFEMIVITHNEVPYSCLAKMRSLTVLHWDDSITSIQKQNDVFSNNFVDSNWWTDVISELRLRHNTPNSIFHRLWNRYGSFPHCQQCWYNCLVHEDMREMLQELTRQISLIFELTKQNVISPTIHPGE